MQFGVSREEYNDLTPTEVAFITKAWETKTVRDTTLQRDAVYNAVANAFRKKRKKPIPLWKRIHNKKTKADYQNDIASILAAEAKDPNKDWVKQILGRKGEKHG